MDSYSNWKKSINKTYTASRLDQMKSFCTDFQTSLYIPFTETVTSSFILIENLFLLPHTKPCKDKVYDAVQHCNPSVTTHYQALSTCSVSVSQMAEWMERDWVNGKEKEKEGLLYIHHKGSHSKPVTPLTLPNG